MTLIDEARYAEKISDALSEYRKSVSQHAQDIKAAKAALDGLSWALEEIDRLLDHDSSYLDRIEKDLKLVHTCIVETLDDVWRIIGRIGNGSQYLFADDFQKSWNEITTYCHHMGNLTLATRIDNYRRFVLVLCQIIQKQRPALEEFRELQYNVRNLGVAYNRGLIQDGNPRSHGDFKISKKISYERTRAAGGDPPLSPTGSNDSRQLPRGAPAVIPSPPISPTTTFSSISQISSMDGELYEHWAKIVLTDLSSTKLPITGEVSRYHQDREHPPYDLPDDRYDEVLTITFRPNIRVSFHCRSADMKSRMMLGLPATRGRTEYTSLSLEKLHLCRIGDVLRIYHYARDGHTKIPWVSLQFNTIERLIVFACSFVAMKCQSGFPPRDPLMIWDDQQRSEIEEYRGTILDRGHRLRLIVYSDRPSGAVRLQAIKRSGTKAGTPLWTAFITHAVTSPTWCEQVDKKIVFLTELRPQIYKFKYQLEKAPSGAYVMEFESSSDTKAFLDAIAELRAIASQAAGP